MSLSNQIARILLEMLEDDGTTEIQRNELAQSLGCVPSQINYVISSRFTPEQGYTVESRRGGGGYIKITRINLDKPSIVMHTVNSIGQAIDNSTCRAHILNLNHRGIVDARSAKLMLAATGDNALRSLPNPVRDAVRAAIFKQMLLTMDRKDD
ncbi:MAG: CtsR family transcriptional regulator [Clostridia bacterium]|nr:CtsR family transcriptional regulator [Clostridia bacterium]